MDLGDIVIREGFNFSDSHRSYSIILPQGLTSSAVGSIKSGVGICQQNRTLYYNAKLGRVRMRVSSRRRRLATDEWTKKFAILKVLNPGVA